MRDLQHHRKKDKAVTSALKTTCKSHAFKPAFSLCIHKNVVWKSWFCRLICSYMCMYIQRTYTYSSIRIGTWIRSLPATTPLLKSTVGGEYWSFSPSPFFCPPTQPAPSGGSSTTALHAGLLQSQEAICRYWGSKQPSHLYCPQEKVEGDNGRSQRGAFTRDHLLEPAGLSHETHNTTALFLPI